MANNSAVLQPQSYPYRIATAPMNNPSPKMDFSIPKLSLFNRIESRWRIFPPNHTLTKPSAFPISLSVPKLFAVIRKNGPNVCRRRLRFWASPAATISAIVGMLFSFCRPNFDGSGNCELGDLDEDEAWILVRVLWTGEFLWGIRGIVIVNNSINGGSFEGIEFSEETWKCKLGKVLFHRLGNSIFHPTLNHILWWIKVLLKLLVVYYTRKLCFWFHDKLYLSYNFIQDVIKNHKRFITYFFICAC